MSASARRTLLAAAVLSLSAVAGVLANGNGPARAGDIGAASQPGEPAVVPQERDAETKKGRYVELSLEDLLKVRILVASTKGNDIFTAPSTVSVIDAATLRRYDIQSLAEALELLPGVEVRRSILKRNVQTFRGILQDNYANKVLILINGVPTWHAATGEGAFYRIAIQDVERIEVLRGPASVIYGTNAYSGAVNIVLKRSDRRQTELDAGLGDKDSYRAGGSATLVGKGGASLFLSAHASERRGEVWTFVDEKRVSGPVRDFEESRALTVSLQSPRHALLANLFRSEESSLGTAATFATGAGRHHDGEGLLLSYSYTRPFGARADLKGGLVYDRGHRDFPRTGDDAIATDGDAYRASGFLRSSVRVGEHLGVDLGADYERWKSVRYDTHERATGTVRAENNMRDRSVEQYSLYGEAAYRRGRVSLVAGSRLTKNEFFGSNVSSRAAAVYALGDQNSLKLLWGQSYRAPSLFELYFQTPDNTVYGNLSLKPETSDSLEAAYVASFGKVLVQALAYHARYENKVTRVRRYPDFVSNPKDTSLIYVNRGRFSANGAELELTFDNPKVVSTFLNLGYVHGDRGDATPGSNNYNFRYVPEVSVSAGLSKSVRSLSASVVANWLSATNGWKAEVPGHTTVDATLAYEHQIGGARLRHSAFAKDLSDSKGETPEYTRGNVNAVPLGLGRLVGYRLQVRF